MHEVHGYLCCLSNGLSVDTTCSYVNVVECYVYLLMQPSCISYCHIDTMRMTAPLATVLFLCLVGFAVCESVCQTDCETTDSSDHTPPCHEHNMNTGEPADGTASFDAKTAAIVGGTAVVGVAVAVAAPWVILPAMGFGGNGIVAGSMAAAWQASIGNVAAGSAFAAMQSAGVAGVSTAASAGLATAGATVGAAVGAAGGAAMAEDEPQQD